MKRQSTRVLLGWLSSMCRSCGHRGACRSAAIEPGFRRSTLDPTHPPPGVEFPRICADVGICTRATCT